MKNNQLQIYFVPQVPTSIQESYDRLYGNSQYLCIDEHMYKGENTEIYQSKRGMLMNLRCKNLPLFQIILYSKRTDANMCEIESVL